MATPAVNETYFEKLREERPEYESALIIWREKLSPVLAEMEETRKRVVRRAYMRIFPKIRPHKKRCFRQCFRRCLRRCFPQFAAIVRAISGEAPWFRSQHQGFRETLI